MQIGNKTFGSKKRYFCMMKLFRYDNVAPMDYFSRLITQFEQSMLEYRQAIQTAELHLQDVTSGSGSGLSAEDIVSAVQRLHQALTHLAAKYQVDNHKFMTTIN